VLSVEESLLEFNKYLKKLSLILGTESKFSFMKFKFYDKKRLDDIMCCIESSWPEEYKMFVKKRGEKDLNSPICYNRLVRLIRNKFMFSPNSYYLNESEVVRTIRSLQAALQKDMKFISSLWNNL